MHTVLIDLTVQVLCPVRSKSALLQFKLAVCVSQSHLLRIVVVVVFVRQPSYQYIVKIDNHSATIPQQVFHFA